MFYNNEDCVHINYGRELSLFIHQLLKANKLKSTNLPRSKKTILSSDDQKSVFIDYGAAENCPFFTLQKSEEVHIFSIKNVNCAKKLIDELKYLLPFGICANNSDLEIAHAYLYCVSKSSKFGKEEVEKIYPLNLQNFSRAAEEIVTENPKLNLLQVKQILCAKRIDLTSFASLYLVHEAGKGHQKVQSSVCKDSYLSQKKNQDQEISKTNQQQVRSTEPKSSEISPENREDLQILNTNPQNQGVESASLSISEKNLQDQQMLSVNQQQVQSAESKSSEVLQENREDEQVLNTNQQIQGIESSSLDFSQKNIQDQQMLNADQQEVQSAESKNSEVLTENREDQQVTVTYPMSDDFLLGYIQGDAIDQITLFQMIEHDNSTANFSQDQ